MRPEEYETDDRMCSICHEPIYGSSWVTECGDCLEIKKNYPTLVKWVEKIIDRIVKEIRKESP